MTSWVEDLAAVLDAASTGLTVGRNLFVNVLPDDVADVTVGVFEQPGDEPDRVYGSQDAFLRPRVLLLARSTAPVSGAEAPNPLRARQAAWKAYGALRSAQGGSVEAVIPAEAPYTYDVDDEGRVLVGFTASAWVRPSTSW